MELGYYTVFQKGCHQTHGGNFAKSQPIFKTLLPLRRAQIFQNFPKAVIFHLTLTMLHHFGNLKVQICRKLQN